MVGYGSQERALAALEDQLRRSEYIAGDRFTAADVYIGSHLGFGMMFGAIDKRPAFERYWELVRARPAAVQGARDRRQARGGTAKGGLKALGGAPRRGSDLCD